MTNFDTMEKELREKRGVISSLDFTMEVVAIVTVAIDAMTNTRNKELATAIAAMKIKEAVSKLFPEETQEEKNTEKDAKYEDLKNRIFNHAADYMSPIAPTVESIRAAEIERSAKQTTLLSLILEAGLRDEYQEWLDTVHVKEN